MSTALTGRLSIYQVKGVSRGLVFLSLLLASMGGLAQKKYPVAAANPVFVLSGPVSLDSLSRYVHQHSIFRFSFNSRKIRGERRIFFPRGKYTLSRLLQRVRQTTGLYYRRYKEHVIFQDNRPPGWVSAGEGKVQGVGQGSKEGVKGKGGGGQEDKKIGNGPTQDGGGSGKDGVEGKMGEDGKTGNGKVQVGKMGNEKASDERGEKKVQDEGRGDKMARDGKIKNSKGRWHLQTGLFASETLYGNLRVEAGLKPIHLIFSYGTDFTIHAWQVGLGSVIHKSESSQWQLFALYSRLKVTYPTDTFSMIGKIYQVKGDWYMAGVNFCMRMSGHWLLKAGASLNLLKTSYWLDGQLSNAVNIAPSNENPDTRYRLLRPPYYLINTFDKNNPVNYKAWIGLSLGIYYSLPI